MGRRAAAVLGLLRTTDLSLADIGRRVRISRQLVYQVYSAAAGREVARTSGAASR
jgi:predicted DNA-binding protein YlxM (UPF0122 family)